MADTYTTDYFRSRRMGQALVDPFDTEASALKGYRRGLRLLGDIRGKRVLDVGCGLGAGSWLLSKEGARVTGVDISLEAIEWARRTYSSPASLMGSHLEFWQVNFLASEAVGLGTFDVLTVVDVLEHFSRRDGAKLLSHWSRMLRPGGQLFLHVPVTRNLLDWVLVARNGLLRKRLSGNVLDHHGDPTHLARYSVRSLARLLERTGWRTTSLELRAYSPRLTAPERDTLAGRWGLLAEAQQQWVTDWDGIHESK